MPVSEEWCIKVNDRVYGPYKAQELSQFAREGRLAAWSLVSRKGLSKWCKAKDERAFASFFQNIDCKADPAHSAAGARAFGRRADATLQEAPSSTASSKTAATNTAATNTGATNNETFPVTQNDKKYVVIFDFVSGAAGRLAPAINRLGPAFRIGDNVWHITTALTANGVHNALAPHLQRHESIFVVEANRQNSSWSNFGPEVQSKISAAWNNAA